MTHPCGFGTRGCTSNLTEGIQPQKKSLNECRDSTGTGPAQLTEEKEKSSVDEVFPGRLNFFY